MKEATSPTLVRRFVSSACRERLVVIRTVFGIFEGSVMPESLGDLVKQLFEFQALK